MDARCCLNKKIISVIMLVASLGANICYANNFSEKFNAIKLEKNLLKKFQKLAEISLASKSIKFDKACVFEIESLLTDILKSVPNLSAKDAKLANMYAEKILNSDLFKKLPTGNILEKIIRINNWIIDGRPVPPPAIVKQLTVSAYNSEYNYDTFIETGTYLGNMVNAQKICLIIFIP